VLLAARWTYYTEGNYDGEDMQLIYNESDKNLSQENSIKAFKSGVKNTFAEYSKSSAKIYIMLQVPMQEKNPDEIMFKSSKNKNINIDHLSKNSISFDKHASFQKMTNDIIREEASNFKNITVIDPTSIMCNNNECLVGNERSSFYLDNDHLSILGSLKLRGLLEENIIYR
jgi:hypothetical protein